MHADISSEYSEVLMACMRRNSGMVELATVGERTGNRRYLPQQYGSLLNGDDENTGKSFRNLLFEESIEQY